MKIIRIKKTTLLYIFLPIIALIAVFILYGNKEFSGNVLGEQTLQEYSADTPILEFFSKNGYQPLTREVEAGKPFVIRMSTENSYDCGNALNIPRFNIMKTLPFTGSVDIPIPALEKGEVLEGSCSMGMYKFYITAI